VEENGVLRENHQLQVTDKLDKEECCIENTLPKQLSINNEKSAHIRFN
jgi:hypothetical protein